MTRVRAPELRGRGWLNTGGKDLALADLRGKILVLDFWTFCCVNCLHVLDELRPLEQKYADVLVIIGVHSPKFEHERDPKALAAAVQRYGVAHPVLDDPELRTWDQYASKAWPTLCVVDPEGYVVASMTGEGHAEGLARLVDELVATHAARGTLRRGDSLYVAPDDGGSILRFPGKVIVGPRGTVLVSDSANHRIVEFAVEGQQVDEPGHGSEVGEAGQRTAGWGDWSGAKAGSLVRSIGSGERGRVDGPPHVASFSEPGGLCLLPSHIAAVTGYDVVVADTVNHLLRGVNLATGLVSTLAGSGRPWRSTVDFEAHDALSVDLSSPWDVAWYDGKVIVAMSGIHQLWWFDPVEHTAGVYAGTTVEALRDGPLHQVWMAQPSGLSVSADASTLWLVDSESSALRFVRNGEMHTAVGEGLFDFGHLDGPADQALFQHPLGVCALPDGTVLVADTYNGAIRRYEPTTGPPVPATGVTASSHSATGVPVPATARVVTIATGLAEPSDIVQLGDGAVLVVESAAHRLVRLDPEALTTATPTAVPATRHRTQRPATVLAPGTVTLDVIFLPAPGQKLDESFGPSTRLEVSASPARLLVDGAGVTAELSRELVIAADVEAGVLQVVARAATCDEEGEHPACHLTRQDWGVPIVVAVDGASRLPLVLRGLDRPEEPGQLVGE